MVRENMRSPRAVLSFNKIFLRAPTTSGWLLLNPGSTPGLARTLRVITFALSFRLLLKETVLSQSEGPDDFYPPSASGGPSIGLVG